MYCSYNASVVHSHKQNDENALIERSKSVSVPHPRLTQQVKVYNKIRMLFNKFFSE